jgi:hypothetical protein
MRSITIILSVVMVGIIMFSVIMLYCYAECHQAKSHYADCCFAKSHYVELHFLSAVLLGFIF